MGTSVLILKPLCMLSPKHKSNRKLFLHLPHSKNLCSSFRLKLLVKYTYIDEQTYWEFLEHCVIVLVGCLRRRGRGLSHSLPLVFICWQRRLMQCAYHIRAMIRSAEWLRINSVNLTAQGLLLLFVDQVSTFMDYSLWLLHTLAKYIVRRSSWCRWMS